ncbi:MAG: hypothetical protein M0P31_02025 [Solirubrobacteraceae bacterium]|nr:hypothetical protein [Solirubrobacteraceae bacterium]
MPAATSAARRPEPTPRPARLLTAAAAVPLGAAVLLAGALAPGGVRIGLGLALVLLGVGLYAEREAPALRRVGAPVLTGLVTAAVGGGLLLALSAIAGLLDDGSIDDLAGLGKVSATLLLALLSIVAGLGVRRDWPAADIATGAFVAMLVSSLAAVVGAGGLVRAIAVFVLALVALVVATRATGLADRVRRTLGVTAAAGVVVVLSEPSGVAGVVGELLPFVTAEDSGTLSEAARVALTVSTTILALLVVAHAAVRRDVVVAVIAGAGLFQFQAGVATGSRIAILAVPVVLLLIAALLAFRGSRLRLPGGADPRMVGAVVLVMTLVLLCLRIGAVTSEPSRVVGIVVALLLAVAAVVALRTRGTAGIVAAVVTLIGLAVTQPWTTIIAKTTPGSTGSRWAIAVVGLAAAVGLWALLRRRHPHVAVDAAGAWLFIGSLTVAVGVVVLAGQEDVQGADYPLAVLLPSVLVLLGAGAVALLGVARGRATAQAVGAVAAVKLGLGALGAAGTLPVLAAQAAAIAGEQTAPTELADGVGRALLLSVVIGLLGLALLAASTGRRPARGAAAAVALGALGSAVAVGIALADWADHPPRVANRAGDVLLGSQDLGSPLAGAPPVAALVLALLGAALLAAAVVLERGRPQPVGA